MSLSQAIGEVVQDAKDGLDLWHAFILGLPALAGVIATLVVTIRGQKKAEESRVELAEKADITIDQVKNDHTDNLRDEITRGFREVRGDIRSLRDELHLERIERIEGDKQHKGE